MRENVLKDAFVVVSLAVLGWALCGAIMFVGMAVTSLGVTLIVHAIGAPVIFSAIAWFYWKRFGGLSPFQLAGTFVLLVAILDFFIVALVINRSVDMFRSPLGTWIPFLLIFLATYLTGRAATTRDGAPSRLQSNEAERDA